MTRRWNEQQLGETGGKKRCRGCKGAAERQLHRALLRTAVLATLGLLQQAHVLEDRHGTALQVQCVHVQTGHARCQQLLAHHGAQRDAVGLAGRGRGQGRSRSRPRSCSVQRSAARGTMMPCWREELSHCQCSVASPP